MCLNKHKKTACLIACTKTKKETNGKIPAAKLYISILFRLSLEYARKHFSDDRIYILSDEYGLVKPTDEIETYDKSLKNKKHPERLAWSAKVIDQLRKEGYDPKTDEFVILASEMYVRNITGAGKIRNFQQPLKGKRIGEQLHFLKAELQ